MWYPRIFRRIPSEYEHRNSPNVTWTDFASSYSIYDLIMEEPDKNDISPPNKEPVPELKRKTKKDKRKVKDKIKRKTAKNQPNAAVLKVLKKQQQKRGEVVAKKRDPCKALEKYGYAISHGELHKRVIKIPANVRLIQYSTPSKAMYDVDAYEIIRQLAEVRQEVRKEATKDGAIRLRKKVKRLDPPPILVSKLDGKIYFPDGNDLLVTEPGEETTDMGLDFDMNYYPVTPLFGMHIAMPDGKVTWPCKSENTECNYHTTLGGLLTEVSQEYAKKCPDRVLNFVQISCKLNAWEPVEVVVDDKPVIQYRREKKPTIMDVGNLAQMMKRGMSITPSLEKEAEKDVKVGATPEPIKSVYGTTSEIMVDYAGRGATLDASFVPWLNANFHRVYDITSAKKLYRTIRGKRPVIDKAVESYDVTESFTFT